MNPKLREMADVAKCGGARGRRESSGSSLVLCGVFIPEQDDGVGHNRSGENTMAGVQTIFKAFLNMSVSAAHFIDEACFY